MRFAAAVALIVLAAVAGMHRAAAQDCKSGKMVPGTLAAPADPCPPPRKAKPDPQGKAKQQAPWSGIHIGGSIGTSTAIRGR